MVKFVPPLHLPFVPNQLQDIFEAIQYKEKENFRVVFIMFFWVFSRLM